MYTKLRWKRERTRVRYLFVDTPDSRRKESPAVCFTLSKLPSVVAWSPTAEMMHWGEAAEKTEK